jgi:crossover junction endodeoxyribonuclease RusA
LSDPIAFTVPLVPPSVNHYVKHTRDGRHYVTNEAKSFKSAVRLFSRGRVVTAKKYEVEFTVYLGFKQRGDTDNFAKMVLDSLKDAGVIHSDAAVKRCIASVDRDRKNPRTEIKVKEFCV